MQMEAVEAKIHAVSLIFQSEKTLTELGDKVTEAEKAPVTAAIEKLKETVKSGDTDAIKADTEALEKSFYAISEKLYAQAQNAQGGADAGAGAGAQNGGAQTDENGNTYYNADFEDKTGK